MANKTQEQLYEVFMEAAGSQAQALEPVAGASGAPADSHAGHCRAGERLLRQLRPAHVVGRHAKRRQQPLSIAATVFESGLGVIPLVTGLLGLFGGGSSDTPAPLVKYAMPDKTYFEGADTGSGIGGSDYDQMGNPRPYSADAAPDAAAGASPPTGAADHRERAGDGCAVVSGSQQRHRAAVRDAMLNMNSINDVVNELYYGNLSQTQNQRRGAVPRRGTAVSEPDAAVPGWNEQRYRDGAGPLHRWRIPLNLLDEGEMAALGHFFADSQGAFAQLRLYRSLGRHGVLRTAAWHRRIGCDLAGGNERHDVVDRDGEPRIDHAGIPTARDRGHEPVPGEEAAPPADRGERRGRWQLDQAGGCQRRIYEWSLRYAGSEDAELATLQQFFTAAEGTLNAFTFLDPTSNLLAWSDHLDNAVWVPGPLPRDRGRHRRPDGRH